MKSTATSARSRDFGTVILRGLCLAVALPWLAGTSTNASAASDGHTSEPAHLTQSSLAQGDMANEKADESGLVVLYISPSAPASLLTSSDRGAAGSIPATAIAQPETWASVATEVEGRDSTAQMPLAAQISAAQQTEPSARRSEEKLEEVVVTGRYEFLSADTSGTTNLPLPIEQVPQSISLVNNDFIMAADLKTLASIAEYTPGAINSGNAENEQTQMFLRGFPAGRAVDGVPVTAAGAGYGGYEPDYAIFDRLEVVKGPSSVVYGISSPGGLANFVTKSATLQTPSYVLAQVGSWHNYRIEGQIAGALDSDGHVRAIGIAVQDQGDSFTNYIFHKKTSVYAGLNVDFGRNLTAYLHGGYERVERPSWDGNLIEVNGSLPAIPHSFCMCAESVAYTTAAWHGEAGLSWNPTELLDFSVKGNYERASLYGTSGYPSALQPDGSFGVSGFTLQDLNRSYGVGGLVTYHLDHLGLKKSFVSASILYQDNRYVADQDNSNTGSSNIFDGQSAVATAFENSLLGPLVPSLISGDTSVTTASLQTVLSPIDPLLLLLGFSYSKPHQTVTANEVPQTFSFPSHDSYRAGAVYEFLAGANAYVSFSQSYSPQSFLQTGNVPVPPLTGDQYEVGVKYRPPGARLLVTAALYQITEKNIVAYSYTYNNTNYFTPIGQVKNKGVELAALGQLTQEWQINTGYSYLDPKILQSPPATSALTGETQLFLPEHTFSLYTIYTPSGGAFRGLSLGAGARYVASVRTSYESSLANMQAGLSPSRALGGYTVLDASVEYRVNKWLIQLNAKNLTNKYYLTNNYQTLLFGNTMGDPTNFALSIRRTF